MATLQIRQVNRQGQISIGKKHSGRKVEISEYSDGTVVLRPVEVISEFELRLLKDKAFQQRLGGFNRWEKENAPAETDLAALEDNLEAWSKFSRFPGGSVQAGEKGAERLDSNVAALCQNGFSAGYAVIWAECGEDQIHADWTRAFSVFATGEPVIPGDIYRARKLSSIYRPASKSWFGVWKKMTSSSGVYAGALLQK